MKHKMVTADENHIFDEILITQKILAQPDPQLQSIRNELKRANEEDLPQMHKLLSQEKISNLKEKKIFGVTSFFL